MEKTLNNLQADHLDLWQINNVRAAELNTLDKFFAAGGVVKAMEKAREGNQMPAIEEKVKIILQGASIL